MKTKDCKKKKKKGNVRIEKKTKEGKSINNQLIEGKKIIHNRWLGSFFTTKRFHKSNKLKGYEKKNKKLQMKGKEEIVMQGIRRTKIEKKKNRVVSIT